MATYRNKTDQDQILPNIGLVEAGKTIETDKVIENSNFELVGASAPSQGQPTPPQTATTIQGTEKREETK